MYSPCSVVMYMYRRLDRSVPTKTKMFNWKHDPILILHSKFSNGVQIHAFLASTFNAISDYMENQRTTCSLYQMAILHLTDKIGISTHSTAAWRQLDLLYSCITDDVVLTDKLINKNSVTQWNWQYQAKPDTHIYKKSCFARGRDKIQKCRRYPQVIKSTAAAK